MTEDRVTMTVGRLLLRPIRTTAIALGLTVERVASGIFSVDIAVSGSTERLRLFIRGLERWQRERAR